jgi:cupin fold WbuC family metalloprotein
MKFFKKNDEVLIADGNLSCLSLEDIDYIKKIAKSNPRQRVRICTHLQIEDSLHEMVIVHTCGAYIRPHKHINKSEAVHVIEGSAEVVFFDEKGNLEKSLRLGDYKSKSFFYYRLNNEKYHTLVVKSEFFIFHEITNGPFISNNTVFPSWAPDDSDKEGISIFQTCLINNISSTR